MGEFAVHRTGGAYGLGWFAIVVAVVAATSATFASGLATAHRFVALAVAITIGAAGYLFGVRPAVEEEPERLVVRNLLRDVVLPWSCIERTSVADVLVLHTSAGSIRCYAVPRRAGRQRLGSSIFGFGQLLVDRRGGEPATPAVGDTHAVSDRIAAMADRFGAIRASGEVATCWSGAAAAALLALLLGALSAALLW